MVYRGAYSLFAFQETRQLATELITTLACNTVYAVYSRLSGHNTRSSHMTLTFYTWVLNRLDYLRGMLELRCHFETLCGSYMGGNTLESIQQWSPSNTTVDATISPKELGTFAVICTVFLLLLSPLPNVLSLN